MARRNCTSRSREDYFCHLCRVFEDLPSDPTVADLTPESLRDCLDKWAGTSPSTRYKVDSIFRAFAKWLYLMELVDRNLMDRIPRPAPAVSGRGSVASGLGR